MNDDTLVLLLALRQALFIRLAALARLLAGTCAPNLAHMAQAAGADLRPHWPTAERQAAAVRALGIHVVPVWQLPPRLLRVTPLPVALFVRGDVQLLRAAAVSVIGSRRAAPAACQWASELATVHAGLGTLVVSGGAVGIDASAHAGALQAGGRTLAYVGCAVDTSYPMENRRLFERMVAGGGAVVSEHPPGQVTHAYHHAARNRFIAAHAGVLVVAEAAARSGTLGTVATARRLGVDIWVSPTGVARLRGGLDLLLKQGWAREYQTAVQSHAQGGGLG